MALIHWKKSKSVLFGKKKNIKRAKWKGGVRSVTAHVEPHFSDALFNTLLLGDSEPPIAQATTLSLSS